MIMMNTNTDHNFSIETIESLFPFERDIYYGLLLRYIEERNEQNKNG